MGPCASASSRSGWRREWTSRTGAGDRKFSARQAASGWRRTSGFTHTSITCRDQGSPASPARGRRLSSSEKILALRSKRLPSGFFFSYIHHFRRLTSSIRNLITSLGNFDSERSVNDPATWDDWPRRLLSAPTQDDKLASIHWGTTSLLRAPRPTARQPSLLPSTIAFSVHTILEVDPRPSLQSLTQQRAQASSSLSPSFLDISGAKNRLSGSRYTTSRKTHTPGVFDDLATDLI